MARIFLIRNVRFFWVGLATLFMGCSGMFYYPSPKVFTTPTRLGIQYQDTTLISSDGNQLRAWRLFHDSTHAYAGQFALFHGNGENMTSHFLNFAWVTQHGYDLFVFDYPGYGQSSGEANQAATQKSGQTVLAYLSQYQLHHPGQLVLVGQSLGSAILLEALLLDTTRIQPDWTILDGAFSSYRRTAQKTVMRHFLTWWLWPFTYPLIQERPVFKGKQPFALPGKTLVVGCHNDPIVDSSLTVATYHRISSEKYFWRVDSCGHTQAFRKPKIRAQFLKDLRFENSTTPTITD